MKQPTRRAIPAGVRSSALSCRRRSRTSCPYCGVLFNCKETDEEEWDEEFDEECDWDEEEGW